MRLQHISNTLATPLTICSNRLHLFWGCPSSGGVCVCVCVCVCARARARVRNT